MKSFSEYLNESMGMEKMMSKAEKMMPKEVKKQDDDFQYAWMRGAMSAMSGKVSSMMMDKEFMSMLKEIDKKDAAVLKQAWKAGYEFASNQE